MGAWTAILTDEDRAQALTTVRAIARGLTERYGSSAPGPTLSGGAAGIALFFAYADQVLPGAGYGVEAQRHLSQAIDLVATTPLSPGLYGGFTGVAWAVTHVLDLLGSSGDDPVADIDAALVECVGSLSPQSEYDLISGLVGIGLYACERLPRPAARELLRLVVERLQQGAEQSPAGTTWWTAPERIAVWRRSQFPSGWYNLGVAHGVPGAISLLGMACAAGVAADQARPLLEGALAWVKRQRLPEPTVSAFPYWVGSGIESGPSRLAWCYGDAGIAATLLAAGAAAGDEPLQGEALELARKAARRPAATAQIEEPGLCHGAAGLGHLFNRIYQATGDPLLLQAARDWYRETLAMRRPDRGIAGYQALAGTDTTYWADDPGYLTGVAGIGLALLAAATDQEPCWDRLLLASSPIPTPEAKSAHDERQPAR